MPDLSDLRRSLEQAASHYPAERTDPASLDGRPAPSRRRARALPLVAAAVVALLIAGVVATAAAAGHAGHPSHRLQVTGPGRVAPTSPSAPPAPSTTPTSSADSTPAPSGASSTVPPGHPPSTTVVPTTAPRAATSSTTMVRSGPTTTAPATPAACAGAAVSVTSGSGFSGLGHESLVFLFTNRGTVSCTLSGYPGLDGGYADGQTVAATRSLDGFNGGVRTGSAPPTVTLAPGATASAMAEDTDNQVGSETSCPTFTSFEITPPDARTTVTLHGVSMLDCSGLVVHPVVPGTTGTLGQ